MSAPLPPLPPLGQMDSESVPGGRNMPAVLADQHAQLGRVLDQLAAASRDDLTGWDEAALRSLTSVLVASLSRHLSAEEQYLYPAVRAVVPEGDAVADRELAADRDMQHALRRLEAGPATDLRGLAEVEPALRSHVRRCDRQIFPALREGLDDVALIRLGNRVEIALEAAPSRPHPGLAATPPFNKLLAPVVGAVDYVRDLATRRVTYPEDL
jgi:hemerythrin-like domain-containing protein